MNETIHINKYPTQKKDWDFKIGMLKISKEENWKRRVSNATAKQNLDPIFAT
jgi:hypothetical protein